MLMMTWGYLLGDQSLTSVGLNYTLMQENLRQGYVDYHDNMTTLSRDIWIAPVGLGFANVYQSVQESGTIPETPGSAFHSLYDGDGEHPSLKGSYLAACIIYASMTGNLSVETNDTVVFHQQISWHYSRPLTTQYSIKLAIFLILGSNLLAQHS